MSHFSSVQGQTSEAEVLLGDADGIFRSIKVDIYPYFFLIYYYTFLTFRNQLCVSFLLRELAFGMPKLMFKFLTDAQPK